MKQIPFTCSLDCGSRCELVALVDGERLVRIDTPANRPDTLQHPRLIPCLRGRAHRRVLDVPERLRHPMIHSGTRGAGSWRTVSWDEALDHVAMHLEEALVAGGPQSILHATGAGSLSGRGFTGASASQRFFSHWAPVTEVSGNMSVHNVMLAQQWMLGEHLPGSDRATLVDSRLILLWGINPAETHMGPNTSHFVAEARDRGAHVVLLDPRLTDSGVLADEWVPVRPGTDAALAAAMAWVILDEGLEDAAFLARCVDGVDAYRAYLAGDDDGQPKTPRWAEDITGVPAATTERLARLYATRRPAALLAGWGPQRTLYGEQSARALMSLACVSGNVGLRGGGLGGYGTRRGGLIPVGTLPWGPFGPGRRLAPGSWAPQILEDRLDPRAAVLYIVASNLVNRSQASLANLAALERVPFVVVQDPFMTPTARYADVVLPVTMDLERSDLIESWGHDSHLFDSRQVVAPPGEARSDYQVMAGLAERLGIAQVYTQGRTEAQWLDAIRDASPLPWDQIEETGVLRNDPPPRVALADFRADPEGAPLRTRSGRIELCNPQARAFGLPAVAAHIEGQAPPDDYPLQLLTPHHKARSNSCLAANPWLQRVEPHALWINTVDARRAGIGDGDVVRVSSPGGSTRVAARVTEAIMPGVVSLPQGTWLVVDENGRDTAGCANVLTSHALSPTGGPATHSAWVRVERVDA